MSFFERLETRVAATGSLLCVGLDPRATTPSEARAECLRIIDATAEYAVAFKPNSAFFEALGPGGMEVLVEVVASVPDDIPVLLDVKRGDIGSTAEAYARAAFEVIGAAAVTASPYLGRDAVDPVLAREGSGVFVLCHTSNPSATELQEVETASGEPMYIATARMAASWAGPDRLGLVVGATRPQALARVRDAIPGHWILAPGVGAQGGDLEASLGAALRSDGMGVLVPVSRTIAEAGDPASEAADLAGRIADLRSGAAAPPSPPGLAEMLFDAGCIRFGEFRLKSGVVSPIYLDLRTLVGHPDLLQVAATAYLPFLGDAPRVAGVPMGGLPLATAVSLRSGRPMVYPRPPKDHGTGAVVEGPYEVGERVTIVDDVATSGISVIDAADRLETAGLGVDHAVVLVDRRGGAREALATRGIELRAVLDLLDMVASLEASGRITPDERDRVAEFLSG